MRHHHNAPSLRYTGNRAIVRVTSDHYPTLKRWYEARGKETFNRHLISDLGYMVDGRVAGWLYLTNSNIAMIECIISDPGTVPSLRKESLNKLVGHLIDTAVNLGYIHIWGISKHPSIEKVAEKYGFKITEGFKVLTLTASD